jgi:hypothetical protein
MSRPKLVVKLFQRLGSVGVIPNLNKLDPELTQGDVLCVQSTGEFDDHRFRIVG